MEVSGLHPTITDDAPSPNSAWPTNESKCVSHGPLKVTTVISEHTTRTRAPALFSARSLARRRTVPPAKQPWWHVVAVGDSEVIISEVILDQTLHGETRPESVKNAPLESFSGGGLALLRRSLPHFVQNEEHTRTRHVPILTQHVLRGSQLLFSQPKPRFYFVQYGGPTWMGYPKHRVPVVDPNGLEVLFKAFPNVVRYQLRHVFLQMKCDHGDLRAHHQDSCSGVVLGEILGEAEDGASGEATLVVEHEAFGGRVEA
ncbi:hypothetical protein G2W53_030767 [Senna tora]|uniref:Uncharacterized protein n=1 Tax=Senna tora TaxID=362788 RepID=A0A834WD98_9FABA|nr:hypothetical protein G2W53_030767 [Senna tora]